MRKIAGSLVLLICLLCGCIKNDNNFGSNTCNYPSSTLVAPANEIDSIQKYLALHAINAIKDSSGFFYTVNSVGSGQSIVNLCSNVAVLYTGKLLNGTVFDSTTGTTPAIFQLGQIIPAWQKGIPLISKGGTITLYVPPTLGYGNTDVKNNVGEVIIPANSVLIFNIQLVDIG